MRKNIALLFASSAFVMVTKASNEASALTNSMRDCRTFARGFDYTYYNEYEQYYWDSEYETFGPYEDLPYADVTNVAQQNFGPAYYELVTCNFPGICPDGSDAKNQCKWQRFLGLWCLDNDITESGKVEIIVATNSLPNHCYYSETFYPEGAQSTSQFYQFSAVFNVMPRNMEELPSSGYASEVISQLDLDT